MNTHHMQLDYVDSRGHWMVWQVMESALLYPRWLEYYNFYQEQFQHQGQGKSHEEYPFKMSKCG